MPSSSLAGFSGSFGGIVTFNWAPSPMIVAKDIDAAAAYLNNMVPPLMAARDLGIADVIENFTGEHDPDGQPWTPWSASYVETGGADESSGILKRTMDLMDSSTSPSAWPITAREVFFDFGALPFYGIFHQLGAQRQSAGKGQSRADNLQAIASGVGLDPDFGDSSLPARPFAGISTKTTFAIIDIFDAWFGGALGLVVSGSGTLQTRTAGGRFGPKPGG